MPTKEEVLKNLDSVLVPGVKRSLVEMNLVRDVSFENGRIDIKLASTALSRETRHWLKGRIKEVIGNMAGVNKLNVSFTERKPNDLNKISHIIAVMSGKGGVGKSLVASLIAVALKRQGYEVGILDADITGPSIPRMFGLTIRPSGNESGILPVLSRSGIEVMSMNLLLPSEEDAVIWRGPLIGRAITQFWEEVLWGRLDYLIVDLPPGTADAPLTVMQTLPISGVIVVFTPQDLTTMVVRKAINMAQKMNKSIIGVIENMSYLYLSDIDKKIEPFGRSHSKEMAKVAQAPLIGQLPIDPELAKLCDDGGIEDYQAEIMDSLAMSVPKVMSTEIKVPGNG